MEHYSPVKPNWRDHVVAFLFVLVIPVCLFSLKINFPQLTLGDSTVVLVINHFTMGVLIGIVLSGVFLCLKKPAVLIGISVVLSMIWLLSPLDGEIGSVLIGSASICWIGLCPSVAKLICQPLKLRRPQS